MTDANAQLNVILAEDNARDMEYLASSLDGVSFEKASRGDDALELFRSRPDSYLITDLQLPGLNGVELSTEVWKITPATRIIVWSQYNDEVYLRALSRVIPSDALYGYVLKNNPSQTLKRAIQSVFLDEQCWIDPQLRPVQARSHDSPRIITDAEYDVLFDIALGMTDLLIAERRFLSRRGVQSRLKSLYSKLEVDNTAMIGEVNPRSRAVAIAFTRGLINQHELQRAESELAGWLKSSDRKIR